MALIRNRVWMFTLILMLGMFTVVGGATSASAQDDTCYPVPPGGCPVVSVDVPCAEVIAAIASDTQTEEQIAALDTNGDGVIDVQDLPDSCTCQELIDAIGAGTIDPGELPEGALADCGCEELVAAIVSGALDPTNLPAGTEDALSLCCEELVAAIAAGDLDVAELPDSLVAVIGTCCEQLVAAIANGDIDLADLPEGVLDGCSCEELQTLVDAGVLAAEDLPEDCGEEVAADEEVAPGLADTGIDAGGLGGLMLMGLVGGMGLLWAARRHA